MNIQNHLHPLPLGEASTQQLPLPLGDGWGEGDQIAHNDEMTVDDFNYIPFNQEGRLLKAKELFGKDLEPLISELNGYLIA